MTIVLPLKTSPRIDVSRPLASWIDLHCQPNSAPYRDDLLRLQALRNCITSALVSPTGHAHAISNSQQHPHQQQAGAGGTTINTNRGGAGGFEMEGTDIVNDLKEYHAVLLLCEVLDFPTRDITRITGTRNDRTSLPVDLYWDNAFRTSSSGVGGGGGGGEEMKNGGIPPNGARHNLRYERICILYNLAALESYMASESYDEGLHRYSIESLKRASKHYSTAAGLIAEIISLVGEDRDGYDNPLTSGMTPDLSSTSLELFQQVLLAQNQATIVRVATQSTSANMTPSILSKLCAGAGDLFDKAHKLSKSAKARSLGIPTQWTNECHASLCFFRGYAEHYECDRLRVEDFKLLASGYGMEITRLSRVIDWMDQVLEIGENAGGGNGGCSSELVEEAKSMKRTASQRRVGALSDNESMYRDAMPKDRDVVSITPTIMAKPSPLDDSLSPCSLKRPYFVGLSMKRYSS